MKSNSKPVREPGPERIGNKELALLKSLRAAGLLASPIEALSKEQDSSLEVAYAPQGNMTAAIVMLPDEGILIGMSKRGPDDDRSPSRGRLMAFGRAVQSHRIVHGIIRGGTEDSAVIRLNIRIASPEIAEGWSCAREKNPRYPADGPKKWKDFEKLELKSEDLLPLIPEIKNPQHLWSLKNRKKLFQHEQPWGLSLNSAKILREWVKLHNGVPPGCLPVPFEEGMQALLAPSKRRRGHPRKAVASDSVPSPKPARKASKKARKKSPLPRSQKVK